MTINTFMEKARKINPRLYLKRVRNGWQVWEKAKVYGPGFPQHYPVMDIPWNNATKNWPLRIKKLRRMEWERRRSMQEEKLKEAIAHNASVENERVRDFKRNTSAFLRENYKYFRAVAQKLGYSRHHTLAHLFPGARGGDLKKLHNAYLEKRGA
jgi:hypothetical protein